MICILLSTYNGEKYLEEQLDSLLAQRDVETTILVRDDGSTDSTCSILEQWQSRGALKWYQGENIKPARSFLQLLRDAPQADFYAFCDQDDIWLDDKLKSALDKIETCSSPALYISQTRAVDSSLKELSHRRREFNHTFGEALITNPSTGCTNLLNSALRNEVIAANPSFVAMHDSWVYQICKAIGGYIYFDKQPHILYRQHGNNVVGSSSSPRRTFKRRLNLLYGTAGGERSRAASELLTSFGKRATQKDLQLLQDLNNYRQSLAAKCRLLCSSQLCTTSFSLNAKAKIAILLNKF
ncbi:MAG: glycosyltransferase family 2 protein [Rikenellaceae bacterium]